MRWTWTFVLLAPFSILRSEDTGTSTLLKLKDRVGHTEEIPEDEIADRDREYPPTFYDELRIEREWRRKRGLRPPKRESDPRPRAASKSRRYERS